MTISAALCDLKTLGWTTTNTVPVHETYPSSSAIVLMDGRGHYLQHVFAIRRDDSDYPQDDQVVAWEEVTIQEVVVRRTARTASVSDEVRAVERKAAELCTLRSQARVAAKASQKEASERKTFARLKEKFEP